MIFHSFFQSKTHENKTNKIFKCIEIVQTFQIIAFKDGTNACKFIKNKANEQMNVNTANEYSEMCTYLSKSFVITMRMLANARQYYSMGRI